MRVHARVSIALLVAACGGGMSGAPQPGAQPGANADQQASKVEVTPEQKAMVRQGEAQSYAAAGTAADQQIGAAEEEVRKALQLALGQIAPFPGGQPPRPVSESLLGLRKAKIDLRVEPVLDQNGKPVAGNFVQVKDSYTDRVQALSRKLAEGKATKKEQKSIQSGAKHVIKINDVRGQVTAISMPALKSGWLVTSAAFSTLTTAAGMVGSRRTYEMEWTDADYEIVRASIVRQRRTEGVAAIAIGLLAAYQVVLPGKGDPKAIDAIAEKTLGGLPSQPEVTLDEARAYIEGLADNIKAVRVRYETQMRETYGDAIYEQQYKASIDAMFRQAEQQLSQKSVSERAAETALKYKEDVARCARGEPVDPGSLAAGPTCKRVREQAQSKGLTGNDLEMFARGWVDQQMPGTDWNAVGNPVAGLAGSLAGALPSDGPVGSALAGVSALSRGDAKGALSAALDLAPGGGLIKDGLSAAASLLDLF